MKSSISKKINEFNQKITRLQQQRKDFIKSVQSECAHPVELVREAHFVEGIIIDRRPFRVCIDCGYAEEGWGCGYRKLHGSNYKIPMVEQEDARSYVLGGIISQKELWPAPNLDRD